MLLKATNHTLELTTTSTADLDYMAKWIDHEDSGGMPGSSEGSISSVTTTVIVAAPAASTQRQVRELFVRNKSASAANKVTVKTDLGGTEYVPFADVTLGAGESLHYSDAYGFKTFDIFGNDRESNPVIKGWLSKLFKTGTAKEAAGVYYSYAKDIGTPGAWAPGTPGVAGRATDGTLTADAGCISFPDPTTGNVYLTEIQGTSSAAEVIELYDILWINSGINVTTLTAQTVNSVALPARDINGTINGEGCVVGILVTTATTNAALMSNNTITYTNSQGVSGRTARLAAAPAMATFPASAVIGTVVFFNLEAGDTGVSALEQVTNPTSFVAGAISYFIARLVGTLAAPSILTPPQPSRPNTKLYNRSCIVPFAIANAATAAGFHMSLSFEEK